MRGGEGEELGDEKMEEVEKEMSVFMWGYLPGVSPQRSPLLVPTVARLSGSVEDDAWRDVCGGGCGFAVAISDSGKLITWGSADYLGQSYVTSGKHEETPEAFPLPTDSSIVQAAAGWAHCAAVSESGDVYTWGWKECVPTGKVIGDQPASASLEIDPLDRQSGSLIEQVSPRSHTSRASGNVPSSFDGRGSEESTKRRRLSSTKQAAESSSTGEETLSALPCLVILNPGIRIATVAAGGRHTLALSDMGQVWGWGYGGEGQLGLGSRISMVSSPHPVPCLRSPSYAKEKSSAGPDGESLILGSYVKAIACGGRHSAVITDAGTVLTFGWGLYGQCGQGSTDDELISSCVSSLHGIHIKGVAAGLWHTVCISADGDVYAFGGNQFGQLGTGSDQAETLPRLLEAPSLENENAKIISCGARHSALITEDAKVFCWGWNKYGQLGHGDVVDRNLPFQVSIESFTPRNIACGWWHTLLLAEPPT